MDINFDVDEKPEENEEIFQKPKITSKENEIEAIQGLIPKDQLKSFFSDRRKMLKKWLIFY